MFNPPHGQTAASLGVPLSTAERVEYPGWWPTKGTFSREEYVGPATCGQCHSAKLMTWKTTPMAHASVPASDSETLRANPQLSFRLGPYRYQIANGENKPLYSVTDTAASISVPLEWAFGMGKVGQTYIYERQGKFFESRLSYFSGLQALDFSPGHPHSTPAHMEDAVGRPISPTEERLCFGCHTTASTTSGQFDPSRLFPGVTCEACHGPGGKHVAAMQADQLEQGLKSIVNPMQFGPVDLVDFCGACHRTFWDVGLVGTVGIANVRFQPYRLEKSRCWGKGDPRLTCIACHNPHKPLVHDLASYDERCLSCHVAKKGSKPTQDHPGAACPVSTNQCVSCHMPRYEVPDMHAMFRDHYIRVVRPGSGYPD